MFPIKNGVSEEYSPLTMITGASPPDARIYPMDFRAYIEVFEDNRWF